MYVYIHFSIVPIIFLDLFTSLGSLLSPIERDCQTQTTWFCISLLSLLNFSSWPNFLIFPQPIQLGPKNVFFTYISVYFPKVFSQSLLSQSIFFQSVYPKVNFSKVYFFKVYFSKVYLSKVGNVPYLRVF